MRKATAFLIFLVIIYSCNEKQEIQYYEGGEVKLEVSLNENGNRTGSCKEYYKDGTLKATYEYQDGVENGFYKEYSMDGNLKVFGVMKDGEFIKSEGYDSLGNVFEKRSYLDGKVYFVEKFNKMGERRAHFALPIIDSGIDTIAQGESHCIEIRLGIQFKGDVKLLIGLVQGDQTHKIDTIDFDGQSYKYCISSDILGENEVRGFFIHDKVLEDSTTVDAVSFEDTFYVKESTKARPITS